MAKYALVTGASRGIGRASAIAIAELGYPVIVNYLSNDAAAAETVAIIEEKGGKAETLRFDISDKTSVESSLDKWKEEHPDDIIEVLVNNAGIRQDQLLVFMTDEQWSSVLDTTLNGFFNVTRYLIKDMITNRYGRVINITSLSGQKGLPGQANYSAAKAGIIGATKALAQEVAKRKITVNAVAPGFISTDMTSGLDEASLKSLIPVQRFGKPEEVADVVAFLASRKASYITGEVISVNGGLYC
ncbi:MAG: 3-oxoacyl-ACP reductase FabG [Bacteroidales bacterium]|nr:3-oxoacyl-ACP reductase FabG [Bacteroidales bacterium]